MAKQEKRIALFRHGDCKHCQVVRDKFLSNNREPLMGKCRYYEYLFLLNEKTNCSNYE